MDILLSDARIRKKQEDAKMKKIVLMAALLFGGAQALEVRVFEPTLERVIGYGKLEGNTLTFSLVKDASGPAVVFVVDNQGDVESFKATIDKNVVSLTLPNAPNSASSSAPSSAPGGASRQAYSSANPLTSLKAYIQSNGWQFVQTLVNGNLNNLPGSSGTKKK
jgi:hypothetical protein